MAFARAASLALTLLIGLQGLALVAQTLPDPVTQQGIQPFQSYAGGDIDSVNLSTGTLSIHLPLASYPQRGTLHLDYGLYYGNTTATEVIKSGAGVPINGHWTLSGGYLGIGASAFPFVQVIQSEFPCGYTPPCVMYQATLYEGNGTSHPLGFTNANGTEARSIDGTGFLVENPLQSNCSITDIHGVTTSQVGSMTFYTDPNGNQMTAPSQSVCFTYLDTDQPSSPYIGSPAILDTLGRTVPSAASNPWLIPAPNGGNASYQWVSSGPGSWVIGYSQSLVLPDGKSYVFTFTPITLPLLPRQTTAQTLYVLSSITFPSGGSISYGYAPEAYGAPCTGTTAYAPVTSRTVNANDGTAPQTWTYSYSFAGPSQTSGAPTTTVTDPLGNTSVHTYDGSQFGVSACSPYETQLQVKDRAGNTLETTQTSYEGAVINAAGYGIPVGVDPTSVATLWPNGQQDRVVMTYDRDHGTTFGFSTMYLFYPSLNVGVGYPCNIYTNACGQTGYTSEPWTSAQYDYGQGKAGALLRTTTTTYKAFTDPTYFTNNLLDLPISVQVQDGDFVQRSYITYGYDETGVRASGVTQQKVAGETYPGNQTSIHRWLSGGGAQAQSPCNSSVVSGGYLVTNSVFFDSGEIYTATDPCKYTTTYIYDAAYDGAYPTTVTNQSLQITSSTYDFNTGLLTSKTDPNGDITTLSYDVMKRPTSTVYPDTGWTSYCYTDTGGSTCAQASSPPYSVVTSQAMNLSPVVNMTSTMFFDGLGRANESIEASGAIIATTYDALGRVSTTTNPYFTTGEPTYGVTTYSYDALNRKTLQKQSDGTSTQRWAYNGSAVTFTDEDSNQWIRTSDALGRLTNVQEPGGQQTTYTYDVLNDLTSVNQKGTGSATPRVRTFSYDSLSRLITVWNPETGAVCYGTYTASGCSGGYDADGNLLSKTDARGVTVSYAYDQLNRLISKNYNDGVTPSICYQYDGTSVSGAAVRGFVGRLANEWTTYAACPVGGAQPASFLTQRSILSYDRMGRPTKEEQCTTEAGNCTAANPNQFALNYGYDLAGNMTSSDNGLGTITITKIFDSAGRLNQVNSSAPSLQGPQFPSPLFSQPSYTGAGGLSAAQYGPALSLNWTYDNRLRPWSETVQLLP